jgi:hypothetical protein
VWFVAVREDGHLDWPTRLRVSVGIAYRLDSVIRSCTDREARRRPAMTEVARQLREITAMPPDAATPKVSPLWWAELEIISTEAT